MSAVDLTNWTVQEYVSLDCVPEFCTAANWVIDADGQSALQTQNSRPSLLCSDIDVNSGTSLEGRVVVESFNGDNDYFGFGLGYSIDDNTNPDARWYLVDWKRQSQPFPFPCEDGTAREGLAVSEVSGIPNDAEFWAHDDYTCSDLGGIQEIARGSSLGFLGWTANTDYVFRFEVFSNNILVYIDDILEVNVFGSFDATGKFCFYNFSQDNVRYSGLTRTTPQPSQRPTVSPTMAPTSSPTIQTTDAPTIQTTFSPTRTTLSPTFSSTTGSPVSSPIPQSPRPTTTVSETLSPSVSQTTTNSPTFGSPSLKPHKLVIHKKREKRSTKSRQMHRVVFREPPAPRSKKSAKHDFSPTSKVQFVFPTFSSPKNIFQMNGEHHGFIKDTRAPHLFNNPPSPSPTSMTHGISTKSSGVSKKQTARPVSERESAPPLGDRGGKKRYLQWADTWWSLRRPT